MRSMGSQGPNVSLEGKLRLLSDYADVQADLNLPYAHANLYLRLDTGSLLFVLTGRKYRGPHD